MIWPWAVLWLDRRRLLQLCGVCIVLTLAAQGLLLQGGYSTFYLLPCRMDSLAAGGMIALLARRHGGLGKWRPHACTAGVGVLLVATPWFVVSGGSGHAVVQILKHSLSTILFATFLTVVLTSTERSLVARVLHWKPLRLTGKYSYALYVFHPLVIDLVRRRHASEPLAAADVGYLRLAGEVAVIVLVSFAAAWLSWHLFEKRMLSWKRHFSYSAYPTGTLPRPSPLPDHTPTTDRPHPAERDMAAGMEAAE